MPKYVIEREIPGAGDLSPQELQGVSQKSCTVLQNLGPQIQWVQSYVTGDKIYCIYNIIIRFITATFRHGRIGLGQALRSS